MVPPDMKLFHALTISLLLCAPASLADLVTREVSYVSGSVTAKGYVAAPADGEKHPCVLVLHEWWGANDYVRKRARMLAGLGYTSLVVDLYGNGLTTEDLRTAAAQAMTISQLQLKNRFRAAMKFIQAQEEADPEHIAAIGYGFGGAVALQMARNGQRNLKGVASFHAPLRLSPPNPPAKVSAKVLVCHGGEDPFVRPEQVELFKKDMQEARAELKFVTYPKAFHSFTNPRADTFAEKFSVSFHYDEKADQASWKELTAFLAELFSANNEAESVEKEAN